MTSLSRWWLTPYSISPACALRHRSTGNRAHSATLTEFGAKAQLRLATNTGRLLQEVVVRAARPDNDTEARRVSLHGTPDATIKPGDKAGTYANVYEMIANRVPGVQVSRKGSISGEYSVVIRGPSSLNAGGNEPLYLLDGTTISGSTLLMLDPHTIDRIELIKNGGGAMYGARGAAGIIAFYSKKWDGKPGRNSAEVQVRRIALLAMLHHANFTNPVMKHPFG